MGVSRNVFFVDLCWNTNEWTLNPKFFPEISSGLGLAALWSSDFSKIDFFHEMKESGAQPCFFAQISWNLEVLKVLGWIFSQIWKKNFGGQKLPVFINYSCFYCLRKWPPAGCRTKNFGTYYIPLERSWKVLSSESGQSLDNLYGKLQIPVKVATFSRFCGFCWIQ